MPIKLPFYLGLAFSGAFAIAKPSPLASVDAVLAAYRKAPAIQAKVIKTVHQEVMGTKNVSTGRFYFSKGKLRLDFDRPERSTLVYDGRVVWLESRLDDKNVQVSKVKSNALRKSNSVMAALFDKQDALKGFRLLKSAEKAGVSTFAFEPRDKKTTELRHLEIAVKGADITRIMYKDQMENKVDFALSEVKRGAVAPAKFSYQPPRGASVTDL